MRLGRDGCRHHPDLSWLMDVPSYHIDRSWRARARTHIRVHVCLLYVYMHTYIQHTTYSVISIFESATAFFSPPPLLRRQRTKTTPLRSISTCTQAAGGRAFGWPPPTGPFHSSAPGGSLGVVLRGRREEERDGDRDKIQANFGHKRRDIDYQLA